MCSQGHCRRSPFLISNRLKTTPFQKQPRRRGSSSSDHWQPEIAPRRGPSPVRRCSSDSARASSAAPPEQSPARRDRGQRQRRVKRPASRPASENVPRLGRVQLACQCHRDGLKLIKAHSGLLQGYRADTERSRDSSPAEPGLSPARGTLASRSFSRPGRAARRGDASPAPADAARPPRGGEPCGRTRPGCWRGGRRDGSAKRRARAPRAG